MGEIKSSLEIAMEKVDRLKGLTAEELKEKQEERYNSIGKASVDKYLEALNLRQLEVEVDKYTDEEREMLSRTVILSLASAIQLGDYERLEKLLEGISYLQQRELPGRPIEEIKKLFQEYEQVEKKAREDTEGSAAEMLLQLGISGSAIAEVNIKAVSESHQVSVQIAQPFHDRLERLKQKLLETPVM